MLDTRKRSREYLRMPQQESFFTEIISQKTLQVTHIYTFPPEAFKSPDFFITTTHPPNLFLPQQLPSFRSNSRKSGLIQPSYYSYKVTQGQMASDRNKIIENYCLDELHYCNPDESEIWTAKHKILKKNFTLKRLRYKGSKTEGAFGKRTTSEKEEWHYANMERQAELLKRFIQESCPKSRKMIKTSNNVYLIFEEFPPLNLKTHLSKNQLKRPQRLELMVQIARTVRDYHSLGIIILALSPYNIYLRDKNDVLLADWSLAKSKTDNEKIVTTFFTPRYEYLAKEVSQEGTFSASSDVYSLGKIFNKIQQSGYLESPTSADNKLNQVIIQMMNERPVLRPTINEVIKIIEECGAFSKSLSTKSEVSDERQLQHSSSKNGLNFRVKHAMSMPTEQDNSIDLMFSQKKCTEIQENIRTLKQNRSATALINDSRSIKTVDPGSHLEFSKRTETKTNKDPDISVNYSRKIGKSRKITPNIDEFIKAGNKKRNLAFFLLDLSEFVIRNWICPELGYILLKYSMLTMESIIQEWNPELSEVENGQKFIEVIKKEKEKFQTNLNLLKEGFSAFESDDLLKREFDQPKVISQRYLKQRIRQFAKEMVIYCDKYLNDKSSLTKLADSLFKTYMILKKIEEGSFEKFWDRIYVNENAYLTNQKYLKDERNLGFRYLKSRIAEILKGK